MTEQPADLRVQLAARMIDLLNEVPPEDLIDRMWEIDLYLTERSCLTKQARTSSLPAFVRDVITDNPNLDLTELDLNAALASETPDELATYLVASYLLPDGT